MEKLTRAISRHKILLALPPTQLRLLVFLLQQECEPILLTDIVKKLKVPKADASKDLHALRALHFVRIQLISERDSDGRLSMQAHFFLDAEFLLKGVRTAYKKRGPKSHNAAQALFPASSPPPRINKQSPEHKAAAAKTRADRAARRLAALPMESLKAALLALPDKRGIYLKPSGSYSLVGSDISNVVQYLGTFDKLSDAVATREEFRKINSK